MPGGKRKGAGRPPGSTIDNPKIYVAARISPQIATWLKKQRNKSRVIETALLEYKEKIRD